VSDEDDSGPSHDGCLPAILALALVLSVLLGPDAAAQPPPGETVAAQPAAIAEDPTLTNAPGGPAILPECPPEPLAVHLSGLHAGPDLGAWLRQLWQPVAVPPTLQAGTPQQWRAPNGEPQTLLPYTLLGRGTLGVRLWTDTTAVQGVVGWLAWGYGKDANGTFLDLLPIAMPGEQYNFVVIYSGDALARVSSAMLWEITGQPAQGQGQTLGVTPAPRSLPATGRLFLPAVWR
jgi:hypothetical protein